MTGKHPVQLVAGSLLILAAMMACRSPQVVPAQPPADPVTLDAPWVWRPQPTPVSLQYPVQPPPGVDPASLYPGEPDDQQRGDIFLEQARALLMRPSELEQAAEDVPARAGEDDEPALEVQQAYIQARMAAQRGSWLEAMAFLQQAIDRDPGQAMLHEMLADMATVHGNAALAAAAFRRTVQLDASAEHALFMLGRIAMDQGRSEDAAWYWLAVVDRIAEGSSLPSHHHDMLAALAYYHLGTAMQALGWDGAALEAFVNFRRPRRETMRVSSRYHEHFVQVDRRDAYVVVAMGNIYLRLNALEQAEAMYAQAAAEGLAHGGDLLARRLYTALRRHDHEQVVRLIVQGRTWVRPALVDYLLSQGVAAKDLRDALQVLYEQQPDAQLAMMLARVLGPDQGRTFLRAHLQAFAEDLVIYQALLTDLGTSEGHQQIHAALRLAAQVLLEAPGTGEQILQMLQRWWKGPSLLEDELGHVLADPRELTLSEQSGLRSLLAMLQAEAGQIAMAIDTFELAVELAPGNVAARLHLARLLLKNRFPEQALNVLEPLAEQPVALVATTRARALAAMGRVDQARELLEPWWQAERISPLVVRERAAMERSLHDLLQAERTLLQGMIRFPHDAGLYSDLFELYYLDDERVSVFSNLDRRRGQLRERVMRHLPESRLARMLLAGQLVAQRRFGQARQLLDALHQENPRDAQVLAELLQLCIRMGETEQAVQYMQASLGVGPRHLELLAMAMYLYSRLDQAQPLLEVAERYFALTTPATRDRLQVAQWYGQSGQLDQAQRWLDPLLDASSQEKVLMAARLLLFLQVQQRADELALATLRSIGGGVLEPVRGDLAHQVARTLEQRGEQVLAREVLETYQQLYPDHPVLNNDLAYVWAVKGERLEEALVMARRAVDAAPDQAAYLDTLGWVYYRKGHFEQARAYLQQAADLPEGDHPVIRDHLGDALYRLDRRDAAGEAWRGALQQIEAIEPIENDPELQSLRENLPRKIDAWERGAQVIVAPTRGEQATASQREHEHPADDDDR